MPKTSFSENKHPRFMKEFSFHDPYGKSRFYRGAAENADFGKLTKLISICGMLLQTKGLSLLALCIEFLSNQPKRGLTDNF